MMRLIYIQLCLLIALFSVQSLNASTEGIIDLSTMRTGESYSLLGKWAFYPGEFIYPQTTADAKYYFQIDKPWNNAPKYGEKMGKYGKATYAIRIILPKSNVKYGINVGTIGSAYALYINNRLVKTSGQPYDHKNGGYQAAYNTQIADFTPQTQEIIMTLHVANYSYNKGGIWQDIRIAKSNTAHKKRKSRVNLLFILFGGIMIMSLYHGGLYLLRSREKSSLFFFLWTMAAGIRLLFSARYYPVLDMFEINWHWLVKIEYLNFYLGMPLFIKFLSVLYPKCVNKHFVNVSMIIGAGFVLTVFFTPVSVFTHTVYYFQGFALICILYMFYVLYKTLRFKKSDSGIFLLGFIILAVSVVHDILVANHIITHEYWFAAGLLFFVFSQAYLLASRFTATFARAEVLSRQLNYMNLHLEKIVDERTQKLQDANDLLKNKNEEVSRQSDQMAIMNKELRKLSVAASETDNAIIITDKNGQIEWVNRGFERLYGYSLSELHKRFGNNLQRAGRSKDIATLFKKVLSTKKSVNYESSVEARDGTKIQVQTTLSPIVDQNGEINYLVAIDTDIRKLKKVQKELRKSNSAKNKLFSIIAHDLRNPFNTILGLTELILVRYEELSSDELLQFIKDLNEVSQKTYYLLLNLLEWSRTQRDKIVINPDRHLLKPMVEETVGIFDTMLENKKINLKIDIPEKLTIYADKHSLNTVLRNLVSNAIKFTPRNKNIYISAQKEDDELTAISVTDEGIGIAAENINRLFNLEDTYTSEGTEQEKGTGLGLILCKNFIEKNNGTLSVDSKIGKGTTFTIRIP